MNIGELFVNLGIKGSEKTVGALTGVKKGMGEVKGMSLEAKAAIVGAIYALQRFMSESARTGQGLSTFESLTGLSAKTLQQWQYAARQAGVSADEMKGTIQSVQQSMTNMLSGKGAPEGLGWLDRTVGFDPKRARDTFYVLEKLQEFAKKAPPDLARQVIGSFGVSGGVQAAMRKGVFNEKMFKRAPLYGDGEIKQLSKVDAAWANMFQRVEMAFGRLTAKHGMTLVGDVEKLLKIFLKLVDAATLLAEKIKLLEGLGTIVDGLAKLMGAATDTIGAVKEGGAGAIGKGLMEAGKGAWMTFQEYDTKKASLAFKAATPKGPASYSGGGEAGDTVFNVNQNLNFQHDGKDAEKTGVSVKKAFKDAYKQFSSLSQGN